MAVDQPELDGDVVYLDAGSDTRLLAAANKIIAEQSRALAAAHAGVLEAIVILDCVNNASVAAGDLRHHRLERHDLYYALYRAAGACVGGGLNRSDADIRSGKIGEVL